MSPNQIKQKPGSKAEIERLLPARKHLLFNLAANIEFDASGIVFWEELTCVGYNPQSSVLEAVVAIKQPTGYSGGLCTTGSNEYVRFFVDYGSGFQDAGVASVNVHDVPNSPGLEHPIDYLVQLPLPVADHQQICFAPALPKVRAVLSWNAIPSPNPSDIPYFGNVLDANIQLQPSPLLLIDLVKAGVIEEKLAVLNALDVNQQVDKAKTATPPLSELAKYYKAAKVPDHRLLYPAVQGLLKPGQSSAAPLQISQIAKLGIDLGKVLSALTNEGGDTAFEQLTCVGLKTNTDTLGAVIQIKHGAGYGGTLCFSGSNEYVAFWADWNNNGTFDQYLGTASVNVHDLGSPLPGGGVSYSVSLPVPQVVEHLKACDSPNVIRIRGVLSWSSQPSTTDPNALNTWGNRVDALVQLRPGQPSNGLTDLIYEVGGVGLPDISTATFLAFPSAAPSGACGAPANDRPWGGSVKVQGRIYNTGLPGNVRFRIRYKNHYDMDVDTNWFPVTLQQSFVLMHPLVTPPEEYVTQIAGPEPGLGGGWFTYPENPVASPPIFERDNLLGDWYTGVLEGVYDLRLEYRQAIDPPGFYHQSAVVTITLHNHNFTASTVATPALDFTKDLDLVITGGDCFSYTKGDSINGQLRVVDPYFWAWELDLQPATHTNGTKASPACRTYTSLGDPGDGNAGWSVDTTNLDRCGYTLTLRGYDRTIVNNGAGVHNNSKAVGFSVI